MDYTTMIQSKKSKVENSLSELQSEISTAVKYLHQLKENSSTLVRNLTSISTPTTYLEEFMSVNSFLLKSISFLTEFNCKLEMLGITDESVNVMIPRNKELCSDVKSKNTSHQQLKQEPVAESQFSKGKEQEKELEILVPKDNKKKKRNKKKSKSQPEPNTSSISGDAKINAGTFNQDNISEKNNKVDNFVKIDDNSSCTTGGKQKHNSSKWSNSEVSADAKNSPEVVEVVVKAKKVSGSQTKEMSSSETYSGSSYTDINLEQANQSSFPSSSNSSLANLPCSPSCNKVVSKVTQPSGNIPVAEVVPTKIKDWCCSSQEEAFNCAQNSNDDHLKLDQTVIKNESEIDEIRPVNLGRNLGKEYDVTIEYIKSPSEFYVRIVDSETLLLFELEKKLDLIPPNKNNSHNKNNKFIKAVLREEIGKYGLVYLKCDEMWCRAEIIDWCLNYPDDFVSVFLLDFGETKCVSIYDLQAMPKHLKQYPAFAVRCHLYNVFPVDMDKDSNTFSWEKESSEKMKSLTENSKKVRIKIAPNDHFHPLSSLPVTLLLVDQDYGSVNELLVSSKYASSGSDFEKPKGKSEILDNQKDEKVILNNWDPMKEDYESYQNSYDLDINDPSAVIYGYVGKDYEKICKHFAKNGYCFKGDACKKEHKKFDCLGFTTDQEEIYKSAMNILPVPAPKSKLNVQVTYVFDCNKFYCFPESSASSSNEEDLKSLLMYMNQEGNVLEMKKLLIPPSPGQIVIAHYSVDKYWYRARVLECQPENDQYSVVYVDYGNKETLTLAQIRAIEPRYLHLPFQAIQCFISGIEQNPDVPLKETIDFLNERMDDGHMTIEVIARLPGEDISLLVSVFDSKGENIGIDLIEKNYAIYKDEVIVSPTSESIPG